MWKTRLTDKKGTETKYAYDSKLVYCMVKAEDTYDEITVQYFGDNFKKIIDDLEFPWKHKNFPSANQIRNEWFKRWQWKECSQKYTEELLEEDDLLFIYKKSNSKHIRELYKIRDDMRKELHYLMNSAWFETQDEKQMAVSRCGKTLRNLETEIRLLLGLSTSNSNVDANMEAKVESTVGEQNIFSYSPEEMERIQNIDNSNEDFIDKL